MPVFKRSWKTKTGAQTGWYYKFTIERETIYERARHPITRQPARTKLEAQNYEAAARESFIAGRRGAAQAPVFERFVLEQYLPWAKENHTAAHYQSDEWRSKVLIDAFGKYRLDEISTFLVERFKKEYREGTTKRGQPRKPASVNRVLQMLSRILSVAVSFRQVSETARPAIKLLREENRRLRYLTVEEESRLIEEMQFFGEHLRDIAIVGLGTGMRVGELFSLKVSDVDLQQELIHVLQTKSGKPRQIPVDGLALEVLRIRCGSSKMLVFPSPRGGGKIQCIKKGFAAACKEAGIDGVTPHTLRHTYGTRLAAAGVEIPVIMELMGHANIATTMRYVHAVGSQKRGAIRRLSEYLEGCKNVANLANDEICKRA